MRTRTKRYREGLLILHGQATAMHFEEILHRNAAAIGGLSTCSLLFRRVQHNHHGYMIER